MEVLRFIILHLLPALFCKKKKKEEESSPSLSLSFLSITVEVDFSKILFNIL